MGRSRETLSVDQNAKLSTRWCRSFPRAASRNDKLLFSVQSDHITNPLTLSATSSTVDMRATLIRRAGIGNFPGLYRPNNVPKWQRIHQTHDGLRQWEKGPAAKYMLYPYYALLITTSGATMYMMCRMVLGHKTWYGKG